ncbi:MAG: asparagine synthetase B family protein, partial [Nitrospiraceae bacterium]
RWWQVPEGTKAVSADEAAVRTRELIEDSIRLELRADVPVGSCLSGGLDSSTIVCVMCRLLAGQSGSEASHGAGNGHRPQTFSSCHADPRYDERAYIRAVLARTGAENCEVFPDPERLFDALPEILWHQEEPFTGTSVLAQWEVMRAAGRAGMKVLLDGQGADELLLGYPGYIGSHLADCIRRGRGISAAREWAAWRRVHGGLQPTVVAGIIRGLLPEGPVRWLRSRVLGEAQWLDRGFARTYRRPVLSSAGPSLEGRTVLGAHVVRGLTHDLPALLHYEDRNAMAFSVEARLPFLDHRLVEWLVRLPPELKLREGMTKAVLRDAMIGVLPEGVRLRQDKMGFVTPQDEWLRVVLRSRIEALLGSERMRARPYWRAAALTQLYRGYCEGRFAMGPAVWRWINLECWLRRFID